MDDDGLIGGCARKRTVEQNLNMIAPPVAQTAMRGLIANPSKEHLFAPSRHRSTFSENEALFIAYLQNFHSNVCSL